jgi:hypothetical protein
LLRGVRPDVVEAVQRVFRAAVGRKRACLDVQNPAILGADVGQNQFVIDGELVDQKVGEVAGANNRVR